MATYRVNYGNGQVSNNYTSKAKALQDYNICPDPHTRIEMWVGDDAPDGWAVVKVSKSSGPAIEHNFS